MADRITTGARGRSAASLRHPAFGAERRVRPESAPGSEARRHAAGAPGIGAAVPNDGNLRPRLLAVRQCFNALTSARSRRFLPALMLGFCDSSPNGCRLRQQQATAFGVLSPLIRSIICRSITEICQYVDTNSDQASDRLEIQPDRAISA
ncbi:hypothetical protein E2C06_13355 [Dankookia rubra]|uniref:Uncharacterized protein n=1 Tax=Dankookia rubra TaxID=1442381 RepID=A0A4R5QFV0_9PROT|nr:hypothetical protein [Dankookia rubra]TDH62154.1 hypothetical protein E2C06_13355 [Dankookia rubra]